MLLTLFLVACKQQSTPHYEAIYRQHDEYFLLPAQPTACELPTYPWDQQLVGGHPKITAAHFHCKGKSCHPPKTHNGLVLRDCSPHGLCLVDKKPFVSPHLLDLLNTLQEKTHRRVVITTGHRCPKHNTYSDPSIYNRNSKHQIGAEVDFYIEGYEDKAQEVVQMILDLYKEAPFERFYRDNLNVITPPWINKNFLIKLYHKDEGRDEDNQHPYPYIGVQDRSCNLTPQLVENYHRTE